MNIEREEIMKFIAEWFHIKADEDGNFDINSYDWESGCYCGMGEDAKWMSLGEFVRCMESFLQDLDPYDYVDFDD